MGKKLKQGHNTEEVVEDLILNRLQKQDCRIQGWVLHGYPKLEKNLTFLLKHNLGPKFLIDVSLLF